jgi:hypothetical protein
MSDTIEHFDSKGFVLLEGRISGDLPDRMREGLDPRIRRAKRGNICA